MSADALFDSGEGRSPTWSVAELSAHIARVASQTFPADIWVTGQIRNLNRSANGHCYFDLAEPTKGGAPPRNQISVTLLAPERRYVNEVLTRSGGGVRMDDGIEVRIKARLRWWSPRGQLQLNMSDIDPAFTIGRLQADRERTLAALAADGLLDANGRLAVPPVPLRIGLITSRGSAAHADVISELTHSGIAFTVTLADARTQGKDSGPSVVRALKGFAAMGPSRPDVVLVVRGGGARTDLVAFDSDLVARAIATMPVPVFTGIGHEVDRSIADEVAHSSFKTPTAAAGAVVAAVRGFLISVDEAWAAIDQRARSVARSADARLDRRVTRIGNAAVRNLDRRERATDAVHRRAVAGAVRTLTRADASLTTIETQTASRARRPLEAAGRHLDVIEAQIRAHDPERALRRGWSITTRVDGRPLGSLTDLAAGDHLVTRMAEGFIHSTVTGVAPAAPPPDHPEQP